MWLGYAELFLLSGLALSAGAAVGRRMQWRGRAELLVGTTIVAHALVTAPTLLLGWMGWLYPSLLAAASAGLSLATLALALGRDWRVRARELREALRGLLALPVDAFVVTLRPPSIAFLGIATVALGIAWTAWASYIAPSSSWDGTWYHETIVGYALQNHGFAFVDIPQTLTYVNSFPRVCEMLNLWFVIFTDRRLIEVANTAMAPALLVGLYLIVRRYADRAQAMGWAAVFFLTPAVVLQMRSTYIDLHVATLLVAALHFTTRPQYRLRDALMAGLCIALLMGTKYHAFMWAPLLAAVGIARGIVHHGRSRKRALLATVAASVALMALVAGPVHVRNWSRYHNPFYPIAIDSQRFGIHWGGYQHVDDIVQPFSQMVDENYATHVPGHDYYDTKVHSYGLAIPWAVVPTVLLALPFALLLVIRGFFLPGKRDLSAINLLWTVLPLLVTAPFSPALWLGRYNIHVAAVLVVCAGWGASRPGVKRLGEATLGAAVILSLIMMWWFEPGLGGASYQQFRGVLRVPAEHRDEYDWPMYAVPTRTASARERELGAGKVVAYTDGPFPSLLWNDEFSNRIQFVPFDGIDSYRKRLRDIGATWAVAQPGTGEYGALQAATGEWELLGLMTSTENWTAFRRRP